MHSVVVKRALTLMVWHRNCRDIHYNGMHNWCFVINISSLTLSMHVRPAVRPDGCWCMLPTAFIIPLVTRAVCSRSRRSPLTAFSRPSTYTCHILARVNHLLSYIMCTRQSKLAWVKTETCVEQHHVRSSQQYVGEASEWVVFRPARHVTDHFGDESFQAITCTGTDNSEQTAKNTPRTQNKQTGSR